MIEVSHLTKHYGPRAAISDLNFNVQKGEIVGFLGPNGAGKSTTMKIITGFMPATEGSVKVAGYDVFRSPLEVKSRIGFLPETPPVYPEMIVSDYLEFAARLHGVEKSKVKGAVSSALEKTNLGGVRGRIIGNLSKGFRQRVGLAQALVHNAPVLILDEPTVGLDPKQIIEIRELIKGLKTDHTVVLSTHILPEVTATCGRILIINKGQIVAQNTIEELESRLRGGHVYALHCKHLNDSGISALRAITGVKSLSPSGNRIIVEMTAEGAESRDRLVETAVTHKMGVLEFSTEHVSLEEIFLQLTTSENLSTDAAGGAA